MQPPLASLGMQSLAGSMPGALTVIDQQLRMGTRHPCIL